MKNTKGESNNPLFIIFGAIILVLLGLALITSVANTKASQTNLLSVADEQSNLKTLACYTDDGQVNESLEACNITVNAWYSTGDWRLSESQCDLSSVSVTNDTGTALTEDTDYILHADLGIIQLLNTSTTENSSATLGDNLVEVDYSYCGSGYLTSSGDRGIANLWTVMMIIVLIGALAAAAYKMFGKQ
jgi:hypothetical protein